MAENASANSELEQHRALVADMLDRRDTYLEMDRRWSADMYDTPEADMGRAKASMLTDLLVRYGFAAVEDRT